MGLLGVIRWLAPVLPIGTWAWGDTASALCIIGMIYASLIAIRQDDLKRLVAYSSIAHIGLMCLAIFSTTQAGMQGVMIQMFNHGINIIGLWIVVDLIERQFHTRKISELGGLAQKAPVLAILLVIVALANVALPLTNAFVGEFLLFSGVYTSTATSYNMVFTVTAGISIILSAVYTLNMIQKGVFRGYEQADRKGEGSTDEREADPLRDRGYYCFYRGVSEAGAGVDEGDGGGDRDGYEFEALTGAEAERSEAV